MQISVDAHLQIHHTMSNRNSRFFLKIHVVMQAVKDTNMNKPGTAKVGAISKAQNCKRAL